MNDQKRAALDAAIAVCDDLHKLGLDAGHCATALRVLLKTGAACTDTTPTDVVRACIVRTYRELLENGAASP